MSLPTAGSIPALNIAFSALSSCIAVLLPVALLVFCRLRYGRAFLAAGVGALCFFLGAMVLERMCHQLVFSLFPTLPYLPAAYALYGCLAAGIFEETARLGGLWLLCRRQPGFATGLAYGIGHGGLESIALVGVSLIGNTFLMLRVNAGGAQALVASVPAARQQLAAAQLNALAEAAPTSFLAAGAERAIALATQILLSLLVWMVVAGRLPKRFFLLSIALHALTDVGAVLYQLGLVPNVWLAELWALASCLLVGALALSLLRRTGALPPKAQKGAGAGGRGKNARAPLRRGGPAQNSGADAALCRYPRRCSIKSQKRRRAESRPAREPEARQQGPAAASGNGRCARRTPAVSPASVGPGSPQRALWLKRSKSSALPR